MFTGKNALVAIACIASVLSLPIRREVPQEHSHNGILAGVKANLDLNNPAGIVDPVFGLLGDAAAAAGLGAIADPDCLQQATADQAFTNAKAAGNVTGQVDALLYRALERNTGSVGLASVACTSTQAVNPEIAAIQQHQDPASANAAATNKAIVLALAQQIAAVGGDPQDALKSGTFAPGNTDDTTGKGNTCDVADDVVGCIFSQNLLVDDATADEINAAVSGGAAAVASATDVASASAATSVAVVATTAAAAVSTSAASGQNLQTFTGALGGLPPAVAVGGRGFAVAGEDASTESFLNLSAAIQRSCSVQHNTCADAANSGSTAGLTVSQCDAQETTCNAAASS